MKILCGTKKAINILLFSVAFLAISLHCMAAKLKVLEGLIDEHMGNYVVLRGSGYDISNIPVLDPSGERVPMSEIQIGMKAEVFLENGKIKSIVIHKSKVEE